VSTDLVAPLLAALREAGVPAYAAPASGPSRAAPHRGAAAAVPGYQLWVGSSAHGRAEETLIKAIGQLRHRTPGRAPGEPTGG
jgi:hypothetical protein